MVLFVLRFLWKSAARPSCVWSCRWWWALVLSTDTDSKPQALIHTSASQSIREEMEGYWTGEELDPRVEFVFFFALYCTGGILESVGDAMVIVGKGRLEGYGGYSDAVGLRGGRGYSWARSDTRLVGNGRERGEAKARMDVHRSKGQGIVE